MSKLKGKIAIVGVGEVPTGRFPERACIVSAIESCRQAILDAGISKEDINYVIPTGTMFSSAYNTEMCTSRIVEELGLARKANSNFQVFSGGSSSGNIFKVAAGLIELGLAKYILCVHSDKLATGITAQGGIDLFSTAGISPEWEVPFGMHYSAIAALSMQRFMFETGTTPEQMASVCVSNRKWAELNPNAMHRKPLTVDEVLASKMLSEPLHAKESNMLADGGSAFIITSAERARDITDTPVYLLGDGSLVTHFVFSQEADLTKFGFAEAAEQAYQEAGLRPNDMDIAELYDSYAVYQLIALEELGLCGRGEAGAFVHQGGTWPGGKLPMTTNGGMLSQGHTGAGGSFAIVVETARQLMGKAGDRQVNNARFAIETSTGGTYMDSHVAIFGNMIP